MKSGACLGNLISNNEVILNSALRIPSFGLTSRGEYIIGYLGEDMIDVNGFEQLISGVIWLVRNGENNVQRAIETETDKIQGLLIFNARQADFSGPNNSKFPDNRGYSSNKGYD